MPCLHLKIYGMVQGINYRRFIQKEAEKLHIQGWVRNLPNGTVEVQAYGDEDILLALMERCETGHSWAQIKKIEKYWVQEDKHPQIFSIKYD